MALHFYVRGRRCWCDVELADLGVLTVHPDCLLHRAHQDILLSHLLYQVVRALWVCVACIYNHAPSWTFINVQCRTFQFPSAEFASLTSGCPACPDRGEANRLPSVRRRGCAGNASAPVAQCVTKPMQQLPFVRNMADNGGLWAIRRIPARGRAALRLVEYSTLRT